MKKILIVDDDTDLLGVLKAVLTKKGWEVTVTMSCDEGLNIFYEHLPDIVLLDINVDAEDGRDMCSKIKANAEHKHIPVIFMSADHEALSGYDTYGAIDIIKKPFKISDIVKKIQMH